MTVPIIKFVLFGGGFAAGAVGIYFVTSGLEERISFLSEDEELSQYSSGWGKKYASYLVSPKRNKSWWNQKFKEFNTTDKPNKGKFKNVNSATEGDNSLKNICDSAYKANSSNVKSTDEGDNDFTEANIWKYCSPSETKIETLKDQTNGGTSYSQGQYGNEENNKDILVYAGSNDKNKWFWNLKQEELRVASNLDTTGIFKRLQDKLNIGTTDSEVKETLRETCGDAYGKTENESGIKYPKQEVFKFCSLTGEAPSGGSNA